MSIVANRPGGVRIITDWEISYDGPPGKIRVCVRARRIQEVARAGEDFIRQWTEKLKEVVVENFGSGEGSFSIQHVPSGKSFYQSGLLLIGDLTIDDVTQLLDRFFQSNGENDLTEYALCFDKSQILGGGASNGPPSYWAKLIQWDELWRVPEDISCAALSLCYLMYYQSRGYCRDFSGKSRRQKPRSWADAKRLMQELGWGKVVELWELKKFVLAYPEYKIVLMDTFNLLVATPYESMEKELTGASWSPIRDSDGKEKKGNNLVLFLDSHRRHFFAYPNVHLVCKALHPSFGQFCWDCKHFSHSLYEHQCDDEVEEDSDEEMIEPKIPRKKPKMCKTCNQKHEDGCPFKVCKMCKLIHYKEKCKLFHHCKACQHMVNHEGETHRCILGGTELKEKDFLHAEDEPDGTKTALIAWDIEAWIERDDRHTVRTVTFPRDVNGRYELDSVETIIHEKVVRIAAGHFKVNMICAEDVFTGKLFKCDSYSGMDVNPVTQFLKEMRNYNEGNVILYAHNSSGFDSKLILEGCLNNFRRQDIMITRRNQKILQLKVGLKHSPRMMIFRDSMCHLPGSLARLAKDICDGVMAKGYFPHKFNHPRNYDKGDIDLPSIEEFEPWVTAKNSDDLKKFFDWHKEESIRKRGCWNLERELEFYCRNDVKVLATILRNVHEINMADHGRSNWFHVTGPGFVHKLSLHKNFQLLDDEHHLTELSNFSKDAEKGNSADRGTAMSVYSSKITEIAKDQYWAVQVQKEKAMCLPALRGGRTEIKQLYAFLTEEEKENGTQFIYVGVHFRYSDVVSMYPFQQVYHKFPVGTGVVHVYDSRYRLCNNSACNNSAEPCDHPKYNGNMFVREIEHTDQPTMEELMDENYGGIIVVSIEPAQNLFPVFPVFDKKSLKCVFDCTTKIGLHTNMVELREALRTGDRLIKVHRWYKFTMRDSFWFDLTTDLYVKKMISSKDEPEDLEELARKYDEKFCIEFGDKVRDTRGKWGLKPAVKAVSKVNANCGWGKHGQNTNLAETEIIGYKEKIKHSNFFKNLKSEKYERVSTSFFDKCAVYGFKTSDDVPEDLRNGYLPIAIYVTAYSRVQLRREALRIEETSPAGPRVCGGDTDSLIYKYYPEDKYPGVYNIPEGTLLGDWEREAEDEKNGGIVEFCALAQKTYAFKCANGFVSTPKTKGVRLGFATENLVSFEIYKQKVMDFLQTRDSQLITVPQPNQFRSSDKYGVHLEDGFKTFGLREVNFKGVCDKKGVIRPFGFVWCIECDSRICKC